MAPGAASSSRRASRGSEMTAKRKTQTTGGKRGRAASSSNERRAIASTKKKKANKGGKENVESNHNAVASTIRAKASQRSRSATEKRAQPTTTTTTATTQKPRKRPARTLVPGGLDASAYAPAAAVAAPAVARCAAAGAPPPPPPPPAPSGAPAPLMLAVDAGETEYERQRAERIRRNAEMLNALRIPEAAASFVASAGTFGGGSGSRPLPPRPPRAALPRVRGSSQPTRASARARGLEPGATVTAAAALVDVRSSSGSGGVRGGVGAAAAAATAANGGGVPLLPRPDLMTIEEYWRQRGGNPCRDPLISDGCYRGWVAPDVCARFGIEPTAEAAWERRAREAGASSSSAAASASREKLKSQRGWSEARALAATKLRANPNSYFYRHVEPGQQQANGEWTREELELFLRTARAHGVGDRWGLFSSWIPQRVGYQASAFYRDVVIPSGAVVDARFRMTRTGRALFVG